MTPIEAVARALAAYEEGDDLYWESYLSRALVAILALAESVTDEMVRAWQRVVAEGHETSGFGSIQEQDRRAIAASIKNAAGG